MSYRSYLFLRHCFNKVTLLASTKSNPLTTFIIRSDTSVRSRQDYILLQRKINTLALAKPRANNGLLIRTTLRDTRADISRHNMPLLKHHKNGNRRFVDETPTKKKSHDISINSIF